MVIKKRVFMPTIALTKHQRELILNHCMLSSDMEGHLRKGNSLRCTDSELEDLIGWLSGEVNHAKNRDAQLELNELCEKLERFAK
ncbi:MAG: hypothetical protein HQK55_16015 [Deltaproteobacteria bacterium]|nr:hypothetical protein [Deltaproteobacteria bacterium]